MTEDGLFKTCKEITLMIKKIKIGNKIISGRSPVFIVAEAGINHNGKLDLALKLVDVAKNAGADAVKFQNFKIEEVVTNKAGMAEYQERNTGRSESQLEMGRKLELKDNDFAVIASYCKRKGIMFLSTPHGGFQSVDLLQKLKVSAFKFGSADLNNLPVIDHAARFNKPMIISTGMANMQDIAEAVNCIRKTGNQKIIVFQCTTDYPSKYKDVNLRAMLTIRDKFNVIVGYSDHTIGTEASIIAVALGAAVLEKHLTLDNAMDGPDHKASANPENFKSYVKSVRNAETILGSPQKTVVPSARQYMPLVIKSVVARCAINQGEKLTKENLAIKRPTGGLPPKFYWDMLGKKARRNVKPDEFIHKDDYGK